MTKDRRILIKNIYHMLSYAFNMLTQSAYEMIAKEDFDNIYNLFAAILSRGVNLQLKQGLYKEYVEKIEDLSVIHGKININETLKKRASHKQLVSCEVDELSENNLYNQILKSIMILLVSRKDVENKYRQEIKRALLYFSTVDIIEDLKQIRWSSIRFQRNNQRYRMLIGVCQLIVEGLLITTESGENKLASFVDDQKMWHLYQNFILEYYRKHYPELKAHSPQIPWDLPGNQTLGLLPAMQTDIVLHGDVKTLIIDAKYYSRGSLQKQYDKESFISGNLYQIYTYVKNMDKENTGDISGMLLYAQTDEDTLPKGEYDMGGNRICVDSLNLNVEFCEISGKLDAIVQRELKYYENFNSSFKIKDMNDKW